MDPTDRPDLSGSEVFEDVLDEEFDDSDRDMDGVLLPPEDESLGIDRFNRGDDA